MPDLSTIFDTYTIPLDDWIQAAVNWLVLHFRPFFIVLRWPIAKTL